MVKEILQKVDIRHFGKINKYNFDIIIISNDVKVTFITIFVTCSICLGKSYELLREKDGMAFLLDLAG